MKIKLVEAEMFESASFDIVYFLPPPLIITLNVSKQRLECNDAVFILRRMVLGGSSTDCTDSMKRWHATAKYLT